jgi:hypothetical protein
VLSTNCVVFLTRLGSVRKALSVLGMPAPSPVQTTMQVIYLVQLPPHFLVHPSLGYLLIVTSEIFPVFFQRAAFLEALQLPTIHPTLQLATPVKEPIHTYHWEKPGGGRLHYHIALSAARLSCFYFAVPVPKLE